MKIKQNSSNIRRNSAALNRRIGSSLLPLVLVLFSVFFIAACDEETRVDFEKSKITQRGTTPSSAKVSFVGSDKIADVLVTDARDSQVIVFEGKGNGQYEGPKYYGVGDSTQDMTIGLFNDDQVLDIATVNAGGGGSGNVSVLLGLDDGTFEQAVHYSVTDANPSSIVSGDFNKDGNLDLATTNSRAKSISIFDGHGDGTFKSRRNVTVTNSTQQIATADFNADGLADLVVSDIISNQVEILLGKVSGGFDAAILTATGINPQSLLAGNLNKDQFPDLLVGNKDASFVSVFYGKGDGTFGEMLKVEVPDRIIVPAQLSAGNINEGNIPDFVLASTPVNEVSVFIGDGNGKFLAKQRFAACTGPVAMGSGDLNGDKDLDIVVACSNGEVVLLTQKKVVDP